MIFGQFSAAAPEITLLIMICVVLIALCVLTLVMSFGVTRRLVGGAWDALVGFALSALARVFNRGRP